MASAVDVGAAPAFEGLIRPQLVAEIVKLAVRRGQLVAELILEPLAFEVALVAGDPFVQSHMRRDNEFGHSVPPVTHTSGRSATASAAIKGRSWPP